jgi:hypothetical protein
MINFTKGSKNRKIQPQTEKFSQKKKLTIEW